MLVGSGVEQAVAGDAVEHPDARKRARAKLLLRLLTRRGGEARRTQQPLVAATAVAGNKHAALRRSTTISGGNDALVSMKEMREHTYSTGGDETC